MSGLSANQAARERYTTPVGTSAIAPHSPPQQPPSPSTELEMVLDFLTQQVDRLTEYVCRIEVRLRPFNNGAPAPEYAYDPHPSTSADVTTAIHAQSARLMELSAQIHSLLGTTVI